jgi:hypothetical protein
MSWLASEFLGLQAAFGKTFSVTCSYWKAGASFLKRVTGRIFTISKFFDVTEASSNFIFDYLHKQAAKNFENHKHSYKNHWFDF